jgi:hypothetical protein
MPNRLNTIGRPIIEVRPASFDRRAVHRRAASARLLDEEGKMKQQRPEIRAAKWLPLMIRLTALGYLLFFVPDLVLATTHQIQVLPPFLARLVNWGEGGDAVAVMFATVYIVWAIFLFQSARAPLAHRLFLDFNLTANSAHFIAMLIMALTMPGHRQHAAGVIVLGLLATVPVGACWLPVRGTAPQVPIPTATTPH